MTVNQAVIAIPQEIFAVVIELGAIAGALLLIACILAFKK